MPKDAMILDLSDSKQRKMLVGYIDSLKDKGKHWIEIRRCRNQRTTSQNAYLFGVVYPVIQSGLLELWGENLTTWEIHVWCRKQFNSKPVVNHNTGEVKGERPSATSDMDVAEFGEYLDKVMRFSLEDLGKEVPAPESHGLRLENKAA